MTTEEFEARLSKLTDTISTLPASERDRLMNLVEETRARNTEIAENSRRAKDALDDLRICYKYMVFDREATERERKQGLQEEE